MEKLRKLVIFETVSRSHWYIKLPLLLLILNLYGMYVLIGCLILRLDKMKQFLLAKVKWPRIRNWSMVMCGLLEKRGYYERFQIDYYSSPVCFKFHKKI